MPYENIKFNNIQEVYQLLSDHVDEVRCAAGLCCRKGKEFALDSKLEGFPDYPHEGGIQVGDEKYWLYLHCLDPKCGYDTALWKLHIEGLQ